MLPARGNIPKLDFKPTETHFYKMGDDIIDLQIQDSTKRFAWRLVVNGISSPVSGSFQNILKFKGYCVVTTYWATTFIPWRPFKVQNASPRSAPKEK